MTVYVYKNMQPQIHNSVFIAPTAQVIGDVHIGQHSSVWFQTVIRSDIASIRIGENTNIQDLCMCHVDTGAPLHIGNKVTMGHRSIAHGCSIEDNCLIGMGAVVLSQAVIGKGSVIAAGSVVLEKTIIPPYSLVVGSPGRIKKIYENKEEMEEKITGIAEHYVNNARDFLEKCFPIS